MTWQPTNLPFDLKISRVTAAAYLNTMAEDEVILKHKVGRTNYYINQTLIDTLQQVGIK